MITAHLADYLHNEVDVSKLTTAKLAANIDHFLSADVDGTVELMDNLLSSFENRVRNNIDNVWSFCHEQGYHLSTVNIFSEDGIAKVMLVWNDEWIEQFNLSDF